MTNKELLELAAKADGLGKRVAELGLWNPIDSDGDALRLAVHLGIDIAKVQAKFYDKSSTDPYAATRRAIVRAAAEIGRDLQ